MEKEIHLLWNFLWHYCDLKQEKITGQGWKIFCSRETISKEQHVYNNSIYVIFNMAAVIHYLLLNKLNSQNCKAEKMNIVDFFIKFNSRQRLYQTKGGVGFSLNLKEKKKEQVKKIQ